MPRRKNLSGRTLAAIADRSLKGGLELSDYSMKKVRKSKKGGMNFKEFVDATGLADKAKEFVDSASLLDKAKEFINNKDVKKFANQFAKHLGYGGANFSPVRPLPRPIYRIPDSDFFHVGEHYNDGAQVLGPVNPRAQIIGGLLEMAPKLNRVVYANTRL